MRTKLLLLYMLWAGMVWGQNNSYKKEIDSLKEQYNVSKEKINNLEKNFEKLKSNLTTTFSEDLITEIKNSQRDIQSQKDIFKNIYLLVESYKSILEKIKKEQKKTIDSLFVFYKEEDKAYFPETVKSEKVETKTYLYFGENKVIDKDLFSNKKSTETELLKSLLLDVGKESYLGDITIPKKGQKFPFYNYDMILCDEHYSFQKLAIEIKDGYFNDIVAYVTDDSGDIHVFTNQVGISVLFYSVYGKTKLMYYLYSIRKEDFTNENLNQHYQDNALKKLYIKVTDIMGYNYKIGNHYIPHDLAVELPQDDVEGNKTNEKSGAIYQIKQNTFLEKIVELRAYTDFLALFGQSQNGLAQIEGRAKFYLFPYPFRFMWSKKYLGQVEYLPSVSPYVNYSKFDDKSKYVNINKIDSMRFELVEKRFLTMGLYLEAFKWQHKNAPVSLSVFGVVDYNLTQTNFGTEEIPEEIAIKALKYGMGINLNVKRFNNFGFSYKFEYSGFNYEDFNSDKRLLNLPSWIPVVKHEAEIFYHPNGNPNQAIFTRLLTYNDAGNSNNQAFYQFQFGYKFSIGSRSIKQNLE
ncbi:hypothetical protein ACFO4P_07070 [Epilithonimonas pallida]|uniref:Uncharacterized protein n=1 Tax=Epilithonimonas pallida TaxID=373671 RepID=A0ABY1R846_9FLAO|nr:hypothetical protein [Epilithonimonas pallida]SMP97156.1 hypothetical protein SAMN05421679_11190 [Epilithonimonas pallida]